MAIYKDLDENQYIPDFNFEDSPDLEKKRLARKKLEEYLEEKRLRKELEDELDSDFDWPN